MAPIFGVRRDADEDGRSAGGKIVRSRRTPTSARTPYARPQPRSPTLVPAPYSGNLNWLSGLIYPARAIASGAGKIFSTVLGSDSSSSSSGGDSDSEYEDDVSLASDDEMNKASSLDMKGESMHLIQQLVVQETFSREECDELIKLIQSRVVKGHESISDTDVCNPAVMEARKWLEDKKSGSGSMLNMDGQMCETNRGILVSLVSESATGSPVDMAKTFMHSRPAWSSPSLKHVEFRTESSMEKFKEVSRSIFHSPLQLSELKKSSLSTGSWNILEEIRKVRAKAAEELLASTPSKEMALPSFSSENMSRHEPRTINMTEGYAALPGEELYNISCETSHAIANPCLELATTTNGSGLPESVEREHDRLQQNEALPTNTVLTQPHDDETIQAIQSAGATDGCQKPTEMNGSRDSAATAHPLSLSAADQTSEPCDKKMIDAINLSQDRVDGGIPYETLEHGAEPSNSVHANDNDSIWTGSKHSSSAQHEDLLKDAIQSNPKRKTNVTQPGRPTRGYSRRGRGRGSVWYDSREIRDGHENELYTFQAFGREGMRIKLIRNECSPSS